MTSKHETVWQNLSALLLMVQAGTPITPEQIDHIRGVLRDNKPDETEAGATAMANEFNKELLRRDLQLAQATNHVEQLFEAIRYMLTNAAELPGWQTAHWISERYAVTKPVEEQANNLRSILRLLPEFQNPATPPANNV